MYSFMTYRVNARQDFSDFALTFKVYSSKLVFWPSHQICHQKSVYLRQKIKIEELRLCQRLKHSNPYIFKTWWYELILLFYLTECIVWNIRGLRNCAAKIKG